jgi:hypothetical protein
MEDMIFRNVIGLFDDNSTANPATAATAHVTKNNLSGVQFRTSGGLSMLRPVFQGFTQAMDSPPQFLDLPFLFVQTVVNAPQQVEELLGLLAQVDG